MQGDYPIELLEAWDLFATRHKSENYRPGWYLVSSDYMLSTNDGK